mmetsp:Transcript_4009/g.7119  ORF Transcript_4009/g.7119 Transcript_4009/m.7119 type:complete len:208 (-) Transcript_4009:559-1182(-)
MDGLWGPDGPANLELCGFADGIAFQLPVELLLAGDLLPVPHLNDVPTLDSSLVEGAAFFHPFHLCFISIPNTVPVDVNPQGRRWLIDCHFHGDELGLAQRPVGGLPLIGIDIQGLLQQLQVSHDALVLIDHGVPLLIGFRFVVHGIYLADGNLNALDVLNGTLMLLAKVGVELFIILCHNTLDNLVLDIKPVVDVFQCPFVAVEQVM